MRVFYLIAITLTIGFFVADFYYAEEVSHARYSSYDSMYNSSDPYGSGYNSYDYSKDDDLTVEAGFVTMGFFLMCVVLYILSLVKIKTTTMKVFSIIGLSLTGIMILWDGVMIASPSGISFNEVVPGWIFFGVAMLAFMIIGTIHAFKKKA
ncbi:MAG: hypothetical protein COS14_09660 [Bacteroidetes bacterium CG02_land_8_20_14_3_00_31_25]|nr:MAG: hypothetical protein COS14_09660 [Bacteroidetes bacterium CG02_land_8_20_14_3_00_31_25]PIX33298.1 MAG: hypothetical protein COZ59_09580 [Bacteroidetes bacterium CG_4_8_14_3_um_filter_31_14]